MTTIVLSVLATVVAAVLLAVLAWFFTPLRNRLESKRMVLTGDHGLRLRTYATSEEMHGLDPGQMLGLEPFWLTDSDFYFHEGAPSEGPLSKAEWTRWACEAGGEGAGWRHILIRLQATQDRTVLVLPPTIHAESTTPAGGVVAGPEREAGGNGLMCRQFEVELDAAVSTIRYLPEGSGETPQFQMAKGDSEAFLIIAHAKQGRFEWAVDMRCLVDGTEVVLRADDHGKPFVTVGYEGLERVWWKFSDRRWVPAAW